MSFPPRTELESYEWLLIDHLEAMLRALRKMTPEHWDWTPDPAAPSARTSAVHAWQWLMCDRQHINEPDVRKHVNVLEAPLDCSEFCALFEEEIENWRLLLRRLTPEDLDQPRRQFGGDRVELDVRFFILHMVQNVIYKDGQLTIPFFALGYDGKGPYTAPFPNDIYNAVRAGWTTAASEG